MRLTYNNLLLKQLFFPSLNFSLSFFYFPSLFFYFFFLCVSYFFSFFLLSLKKYSHFLILYQRIREMCTNHNQLISLYFFITLFKFYKNVCKEMCTNHDLFFFFLLVDINLNHNVILYIFITLLILYW
jgi:hypothetical protein